MEEDLRFLEERFGHETGFKVPDGYFEGLTESVMKQLPDCEATLHRKTAAWLKPMLAAAACLALVIVMAATVFAPSYKQSEQQKVVAHSTQAETHEDALDATADYIMIDRDDIYSYITE